MPRGIIALGLSILSFPLFFGVGETLIDRAPPLGLLTFGLIMTTYFFFCQFMLSRGRVNGFREWPIMLALDAIPMLLVLMAVVAEKRQVILVQGSLILGPACVGTFAGAVAASLVARRCGHTTVP